MEQERLRTFELEKIRLENEAKAEAARAETDRRRIEAEKLKVEAEIP